MKRINLRTFLVGFVTGIAGLWTNTAAQTLPDRSLKTDTSGAFITYTSPYYALSCIKNTPEIAYFSIESGGRSRRLLDKTLLRSGTGGRVVGEGNQERIMIRTLDDRTFEWVIKEGNGITGEFYQIATAPDISPVTVWAVPSPFPPSEQYDRPVSFYKPRIRKTSHQLPAVLHFPDYGLVRIESSHPGIYMQEHIVPDDTNTGLALGPFNHGPHSGFRAYHKGAVVLSLHASAPVHEAKITCTVLDENYPVVDGCDFSSDRFNGLKRCWQNAFPLNPLDRVMGDNILLNGVAHLGMGFKADMLVFTPALPGAESMLDALRRALDKSFRERVVAEAGRLRDYGWESTEVTLISLYDYLITTNDWAFIKTHLPVLRRVVRSVIETDTGQDGIFESPFHGNFLESGRSSLNWWDDFAFGHKDGYVNILAYRALRCMRDMFSMLEETKADVEAIDAQLELFRKSFHSTFFNPETGVYAGWVSLDGRMHDYMFTFISGMAINQGLVEESLGRSILEKMLVRMKEEGYDFVYGIPGPLIPVDAADKGDWEEMTRWGRYENGGLCGQTAYHFIQALYNTDMREEGDEILFKMLETFERELTHSGLFPGYLQSVDWRTKGGAPSGYNYLADNYYFLLAAITGHYGIPYPKLRPPALSLFSDQTNTEGYGYRPFNTGWKFKKGEIADAEKPAFNDSDWREQVLPHDWMIEPANIQDDAHIGPFVKGVKDSISTGNILGGTGWYRKHFTLEQAAEGKTVFIHFDGVSVQSDVWINGHHIGFHPNGYTPFFYNLTPYLKPTGQENILTVKTVNTGDNSRWYPGAGLYRHVRLSLSQPVYIEPWGIYVTTPRVNERRSEVNVAISLQNDGNTVPEEITVGVTLFDQAGQPVASGEEKTNWTTGEKAHLDLSFIVDQPKLWSPDTPSLYTAEVRLLSDGKTADIQRVRFGIRSIEFSAENGFLLNGKETLLKGACVHHDNGLLGSATFDKAEFRRVETLKKNGFNAIRTAHNPPSSSFLDACDSLGILVIDEVFDMWEVSKRDNDYHLYFEEWSDRDIASMILRDRNHPSVIIWSIGNEIYERAEPRGLAIAERLIAVARPLDATRPITQAICALWQVPSQHWDATIPAFDLLDIGSYNYKWKQYELDHQMHPDRVMVGTESFPTEAHINWKMAVDKPYVIGDFVWTGIDYIGEVGIGNTRYDQPGINPVPVRPWPWYLSWCGDIDICGNKKPQSYYRDVVWGESELEILVHSPVPTGMTELVSKWGWPDEYPHWNWDGHEGTPLQVSIYTHFDTVRLYLNDQLIEEKPVVKETMTATAMLPYQQGELTAWGIRNGKEIGYKSLITSGNPVKISLSPEEKSVSSDPNDLVYVQIEVTDGFGRFVPDAVIDLQLSVEGTGRLIACGNAAPDDLKSFNNPLHLKTFRGKALAILQPGTGPGKMSLTVKAADMGGTTVDILIR